MPAFLLQVTAKKWVKPAIAPPEWRATGRALVP